MTGIDRERMLREAYPDPQERLAVRLAQDERKARELGEALAKVPPPAALRRSGTQLTEAQRSATCERSEKLTVRLGPGYKARLRALSEEDGYSIAEWIETWVEMAEREIAAVRGRTRKAKP